MVNIVGDHATYHRQYDTPLTSDIEGLARPNWHWVKTSPDSKAIAGDGAFAIAAARLSVLLGDLHRDGWDRVALEPEIGYKMGC